jgi:hypothetical protein
MDFRRIDDVTPTSAKINLSLLWPNFTEEGVNLILVTSAFAGKNRTGEKKPR